jgi:hypothetical protein
VYKGLVTSTDIDFSGILQDIYSHLANNGVADSLFMVMVWHIGVVMVWHI